MEHKFYLPDPRDPITGDMLPPGPIVLAEHQKRIIRAAFTRVNGLFPFVTILYSAVKKSGKTRLAAGISAWYADTCGPYNEIYCMANDGKQSTDRILSAIKQAVSLGGLDWHVTKTRIELPNGTYIEAIPCDPTGQAGANPGLTTWSEMWGYRHQHKERLWSEMTVPPTRWGHAFRLVESYAGYSDESITLESLYDLGVKRGRKHPEFPELPVYINDVARMFCYWDEEPRMSWQTPDYYAQEAAILSPDEFRRIHKNQWVSSTEKAIPIEWWDACLDTELGPLDARTPAVLGLDASISHDSCAAVIITRHPKRSRDTAVRSCRIWIPPRGGKIDLTETVEKYTREVCKQFNIVAVPYDRYELHKMVTDLRKEGVARFVEFSQGADRAVADKKFFEMVLQRQISHTGDQQMREHIDNAYTKKSDTQMRFVKPSRATRHNVTMRPIDALIAASMANSECLRLNLGR